MTIRCVYGTSGVWLPSMTGVSPGYASKVIGAAAVPWALSACVSEGR